MSVQSDFDFDLMARLAQEDLYEFARKRELLIRGAIAAGARSEKCYELQAEIDIERLCTPLGEKTYVPMVSKLNILVEKLAVLVMELECKD